MHCGRRLACRGSNTYTDVFTAIHGARHPKTGTPTWTQTELESEAALLVLAGSDNTATAITATLFYLAYNPQALAETQAEVRRTFSSPEAIRSGDQLSSCQYLRACVDEAMRLSSAPGLMPRSLIWRHRSRRAPHPARHRDRNPNLRNPSRTSLFPCTILFSTGAVAQSNGRLWHGCIE